MVVCHWRHARFDLRPGCAFDVRADDAPSYETRVVGDAVCIRPRSAGDPGAHWWRRLREGMALDVSLVTTKAVCALLGLGVSARSLAAERPGLGQGQCANPAAHADSPGARP